MPSNLDKALFASERFFDIEPKFWDFVKLYTVCNVKWKMSREDKHYETDDVRIFLSKQPQISKGKGVRYRKTPFPLHVFTFYAHSKEWYCV